MEEEAQLQTINYDGGSITMVRGALEVFLGANLTNAQWEAEAVSTAVSAHQRVRVIGEAAVNVTAHTRDYNQYPTSNANGAAAGKKVLLSFEGSDGLWTGRVSGTMASFADFLVNNAVVRTEFRTARGTKYGPFLTV